MTTRATQPQLKSFARLSQKKYRRAERKFVVEGVRSVEEALNSGWEIDAVLLSSGGSDRRADLVETARDKGVPILEVSERDLARLSDTVTSQGVLAIVSARVRKLSELWKGGRRSLLIVALDAVSDPGNVGTIIRTCDWFGADAVLLDPDTAELYNPKVVRSTMGSLFHIPIYDEVNLVDACREAKKNGYTIAVTALEGGSPPAFDERCLIILGSEARGVKPELLRCADRLVTIPKFGQAESLNVAVSCGVMLGLWRSR